MRILFLTPWYPDSRSPHHGIFVRTQALAVRQHHDVCVISSKIDYSKSGFLSATQRHNDCGGLDEYHITVKRSLPVFNQLNYFLVTILNTWKIARTFKPDIIHGNIGYPGAFWAWAVSKLLDRPYLLTEHTRVTNHFRSPVHKFFTIPFFRKAALVTAVSTWHANEIFQVTGVTPVVVPNIINFDKFTINPRPTASPVQIGFLGGLDTNVKGLDLLLQALASVTIPFMLHIGGKGKLLDHYKELATSLGISPQCVFYGSLLPEEIPAFMERLHFFVSASRSETFGISIVEAMACGLPVVVTKSGGPLDFVNQKNGELVNVGDAAGLRLAIEKMAVNHTSYDPETIRSSVISRFSDKAFQQLMEGLYSTVLSRQAKKHAR